MWDEKIFITVQDATKSYQSDEEEDNSSLTT